MEEAGMLGSFIRLVDYMLVEALVDRTVGTVEELVAMLEAPRASADKTHKARPCRMLWLDILSFRNTASSLPAGLSVQHLTRSTYSLTIKRRTASEHLADTVSLGYIFIRRTCS